MEAVDDPATHPRGREKAVQVPNQNRKPVQEPGSVAASQPAARGHHGPTGCAGGLPSRERRHGTPLAPGVARRRLPGGPQGADTSNGVPYQRPGAERGPRGLGGPGNENGTEILISTWRPGVGVVGLCGIYTRPFAYPLPHLDLSPLLC